MILHADEDIPIITPGEIFNGSGFGNNEYGKARLAYFAMKDLLGDELFKKCLHAYMDRWHGKHPIPWDFFYTFNDVSGKILTGFGINGSLAIIILTLLQKLYTRLDDSYQVGIRNVGGFPIPIGLQLNFNDGSTQTVHKSPAIWEANQKLATVTVSSKKALQSVQLITDIFMDADETDNSLDYK